MFSFHLSKNLVGGQSGLFTPTGLAEMLGIFKLVRYSDFSKIVLFYTVVFLVLLSKNCRFFSCHFTFIFVFFFLLLSSLLLWKLYSP